MAYAFPGEGALDYYPCRYGRSKLLFRGPRRDLERPYVAVLGGTETYGKFVPKPFPALVEDVLGLPVLNLGCVNAGPDVYLNDPGILEVAGRAQVAVVQIMGAQNLSNRFYAVHPRRNDRFLRASPLLCTVFREVDFTEFNFTRHMLLTLRAVSAPKFEVVAEELRAAWVARMTSLLDRLAVPSVLLWIGEAPPAAVAPVTEPWREPLLVDKDMIHAVRRRATAYVEVVASPAAIAAGAAGMQFCDLDRPAAVGMPGPAIHAEVASQLAAALRVLV